MSTSPPFVAINSHNGIVYVVMSQQQQTNFIDIVMNQEQFRGLMYTLKAIEKQFIEDQTQKIMNQAIHQTSLEDYIDLPYDPTKPEIKSTIDSLKTNLESKRKAPKKAKNMIKAPDLY